MFAKSLWPSLLCLALCAPAPAAWAYAVLLNPDAAIKPNHPAAYTVRAGDSLWAVAELFIEEPWREAAVWVANPPDIRPGDVVSLVPQEGRQMALQIKRNRTVKLSPGVRVPRDTPAIEIIPYGAIRQFLSRPQILSAGELDEAPYIVANLDGHLLLTKGNKIYVRGVEGIGATTRYQILRQGQVYRDADGEILAYEAEHLGEAELEKSGDPATMVIIEAQRSINDGDRLLPVEDDFRSERDFRPHPVEKLQEGRIIAVVDGVSQIGQYQIVVLNRGENDLLEMGHVLGVYRGGSTLKDKRADNEELTLPTEKIGDLLVFRLYENISYALVMRAWRAINLYDTVDAP